MWCYSTNQNSNLKRSQLKLLPKIVTREIKPKKQTNKTKPLITKSNYWTGQRCSARFFLNVQPIFLGQFLIPGWEFIRSEYLKRFPLVLQNAAWNEGCTLAEDWPIRGFVHMLFHTSNCCARTLPDASRQPLDTVHSPSHVHPPRKKRAEETQEGRTCTQKWLPRSHLPAGKAEETKSKVPKPLIQPVRWGFSS